MAFVTRTPARASFALKQVQVPVSKICNVRSVSLPVAGRSFPSLKARHFQVFCAAKKETVDKVCHIIRQQLALPDDATVIGESNISQLGADSLDTVEIVMAIEEEFGILVEEDSAQSITTVQEAADMIEEQLKKKGA
ncbi:acyl carrier protein 1, chloroplastic-like isoform X2 [Syzygium oleosum]|uniref:acyl carrier protein 1, chloroplastic-like isoform X2 n=1 Tax=Syzygium oleosum TaxID=219896 RepID=UPI0011D1BD95|nr:acyl carrier protein 1, chloroplastic-like isoform X2 [Syzygium oleosum]